MGEKSFGLHLTLDMSGCDMDKLKDISLVYDLLNELPDKIGMHKMTLPCVVKWKDLNSTIEGISGFVMIAESHISIHTFPEKNYAFVDVFSCKEFKTHDCIEEFTKVFKPKSFKKNVIKRGIGFER